MSISATNSTYPAFYNQVAGSIGPVPVTGSTNAGASAPPPPPPPPLGQNNQNPPDNQVQPNSSSGNLVNKTV